ncbi:MAG: VWA domain-containing protein [Proteobacteria bacterium]|nr:VWA domain-containing protein [Pseudomonadota bacterium]
MKKLFIITGLVCLMASQFPQAARCAAPIAAKTPEIEAVFVLDTTGSMSGLIHAAKEKIWSIASSMSQTKPAPQIKLGLVAFRDRGDDYVTKRTPLTADLDAVYEQLMGFEANGGGDGPESVNQALHEAVTKMKWSKNPDVYRVIFLVGDSPPHMDYQNDVPYPASCNHAVRKGIVVNTIQCGAQPRTTRLWNEIAHLAGGAYFQVEQSGGAVIATTPYDEELASLSEKLDDTRVYYGSEKERKKATARREVGKKISVAASPAAKAQRAVFNASKAGAANFYGRQELLSDMEDGKVAITDIKEKDLPDNLKEMTKKEREEFVKQTAAKRKNLKDKLEKVAAKRRAYIKTQLEKDKDKSKNALGQRIYNAVRAQAAEKSIHYAEESAAY